MKVCIFREYFPGGTNGDLYVDDNSICHTIELPWKDNRKRQSCIPEGTYLLCFRKSSKFGEHIEVSGVLHRKLILFHPANDAARELNGCIAPVTRLTGSGTGQGSREACRRLFALVQKAWEKGSQVSLIVSSKNQYA